MVYRPSPALIKWNGDRAAALDSMVAVHGKVVDGKVGRQYATGHLNRALFVVLASEFQGYCRDLHDEAAWVMTDGLEPPGDPRIPILRAALVRGRKLDGGNAQPSSIGSDFSSIGMDFWPAVEAMYPTKRAQWRAFLENMNRTRNAIAHRDDNKLADTQEPITLATFKKWRVTLKGFVAGMDKVVEAYLQDTAGKSW
ncbi:hypothetical protein [Nocardia mangyaensis]|uniref:hypothetical protein n=1 Tax=Nocardia mangyaensis TaxID=2213200 RepID=UPI002674C4E9|nr:hypothetical protein [Nocardia mangyaensis]MDO3649905.1 hypothetical protein [Nocardia mangyaensis]